MSHNQKKNGKENLKFVFFLNLSFTLIELIGGFLVNSISIMSDAVHDLGDSISLGTAWYLESKSEKKPDKKFTYGYARYSLLGALFSSIVLVSGSFFMIYQAVIRIIHPEPSDAPGMMYIAILGVLVNGYAVWKLFGTKSLNQQVVSWHLLEDVFGWVAVLIVSIVLQFYDNQYLDPILSLAITVFILIGVIRRLNEVLHIFLQGTPKEINLAEVSSEIETISGVEKLEKLRLWSLEGNNHVASLKLVTPLRSETELESLKDKVRAFLNEKGVEEVTIETSHT